MSDEAVMLQARIDAMQIRSAALEADNARLRGLLKAVERNGSARRCPFHACNVWQDEPHDADCPAFTPTGEVK